MRRIQTRGQKHQRRDAIKRTFRIQQHKAVSGGRKNRANDDDADVPAGKAKARAPGQGRCSDRMAEEFGSSVRWLFFPQGKARAVLLVSSGPIEGWA